jgi:hypothetical protein
MKDGVLQSNCILHSTRGILSTITSQKVDYIIYKLYLYIYDIYYYNNMITTCKNV